jgi:signal transduction histidine kinase
MPRIVAELSTLTDVQPSPSPTEDLMREIAADQESLDRLRQLVETGISLSSDLSLESLLRRLIETAVGLTGATYGALGVIDRAGAALEQFITVGIDAETHAAIGDLPRGRGLLGAMIRNDGVLRLKEISEDPRSVGFPPAHPAMHSFLGVPIVLRGSAFGNLYLTEKRGGAEFTERDEEIVRLLAAQAGVAIENARLYEASRQWSRQLESLNEVSALLVAETDVPKLFRLAVDRLRELVAARAVLIELPSVDGQSLVVEAASGENADVLLGLKLGMERSKAGRTFGRNRGERIDSLIDDPEVDQSAPRLLDATTALYIPLSVHGRAVGVIAAYDKSGADHRFTDADMRLAEAFANRVAIAVELSERVGREAVRALLEGQEMERKRLARELHDETGQALASIRLGLKELEPQVGTEALSAIRELVGSALDDVRRLTVELRPPALDDYGLAAALDRLKAVVSERSGMDIQLTVQSELNLGPEQETALYRIVQEALTNIVKHAEATSVSIVVAHMGSAVRTVVEDNGKGFDEAKVREGALGLMGMRERVGLLGGRLEVESSPGGGTTVVAEFPV